MKIGPVNKSAYCIFVTKNRAASGNFPTAQLWSPASQNRLD